MREETTKLLTLFRPATGEVRAVLHPWLQRELTTILAQCPPAPPDAAARRWADWDWPPDSHLLEAHRPPIRVIVVLDNLKGHHTHSLVQWNRNGGLQQFGYPISAELTETLEDGKPYTVQYFERARFEWHPENPVPYQVLLGQFGRRILAESGR